MNFTVTLIRFSQDLLNKTQNTLDSVSNRQSFVVSFQAQLLTFLSVLEVKGRLERVSIQFKSYVLWSTNRRTCTNLVCVKNIPVIHLLILRYGHLTSHKPALNSPLAQTADFP